MNSVAGYTSAVRDRLNDLATEAMTAVDEAFPDDDLADKTLAIKAFLDDHARGAVAILKGKGVAEIFVQQAEVDLAEAIEECLSKWRE